MTMVQEKPRFGEESSYTRAAARTYLSMNLCTTLSEKRYLYIFINRLVVVQKMVQGWYGLTGFVPAVPEARA